jgi:hypothetical protein
MPKAVQFRCDSDSRFHSLKLLNLMGVDAGNRARSARLMIVFADRTTVVQERHGLFSVDFAAARCNAHQSKELRGVFRQFAAKDAAVREQWLRRGNSMIEPCCPVQLPS